MKCIDFLKKYYIFATYTIYLFLIKYLIAMKTHYRMSIMVLMAMVFAFNLKGQNRQVSEIEAFGYVEGMFKDRDVDYYTLCPIISTEDNSNWIFFVDANPMALWAHECYTIYVTKKTDINDLPIIKSTELDFPPENYKLVPYCLKERYTNTDMQINVRTHANRTEREFLNNGEGKTYAVIISGTRDIYMNTPHMWNDCSYIYQVLTKRYLVPKENIYPLISDGNDPAIDMIGINLRPISSPLDLDNDGNPELELAATKDNIKYALSNIKSKINPNDHLFIFITNHGSIMRDDKHKYYEDSYVGLWSKNSNVGDESRLFSKELKEMVMPFSDSGVNVNVILGSCNSGGFVEEFSDLRVVVSSAAKKEETAYASVDRNMYHNIFLYYWTSAVNGEDLNYNMINADYNGDSFVSMEEAFNYAVLKTEEHSRTICLFAPEDIQNPMYFSAPKRLGRDMAFDRIPNQPDAYNLVFRHDQPTFWNSHDLWTKNSLLNSSSTEHENPEYRDDHKFCYIYAKVYNNGSDKYFKGKKIALYWAQAGTYPDASWWNGKVKFNMEEPLGGKICERSIGAIEPGDSTQFLIFWHLPDEISENNSNLKHHYSFFAKIVDDSDTMADLSDFDAENNDNMAFSNVSVINRKDNIKSATLFFDNPDSISRKYGLHLGFRSDHDKEIFKYANLAVDMSWTVYNSYKKGRSLEIVPYTISPTSVQLLSENSCMTDIPMSAYVCGRMTVYFDFFKAKDVSETYVVDLIQTDENGKTVGGHTFVVESPVAINTLYKSESVLSYSGLTELVPLVDDEKTVRWFDSENRLVTADRVLKITPAMQHSSYSMVVTNSDGELSRNEMQNINNVGIKNIQPNGYVSDYIDIEMFEDSISGCEISIYSVTDGKLMLCRKPNAEEVNIRIDTTMLPNGIYTIVCTFDGLVVNNSKFIKI